MSESSGAQSAALSDENKRRCDAEEELSDEGETVHSEETLDGIKDLRLSSHALDSSQAEKDAEPNSGFHNVDLDAEETNTSERSKGDEYSCVSEGVESSIIIDQNTSRHLDEDLQVLKAAAEMVCDGQHSIEVYIDQLNELVESKRNKLKDLEDCHRKRPLLEQKLFQQRSKEGKRKRIPLLNKLTRELLTES